jgi:uncharacterized membrane protein
MTKGPLHSVRNAFLSGLLVLAPLAVTWLVFSWLFDRVGGGFRRYFFFFVPDTLLDHAALTVVWNVLATVIVLVMITALGYLSRYVLGQYFGGLAERFIQSIPGVNTVYNTVKQIVDTFSTQNRNLFSRVVLVEFPRKGIRSIGFLTGRAKGEPQARTGEELWTVFVPTTPNPTSGFLLLLPKNEVIELEMSVGDGMKMVISGGTVAPPWPAGGSRAPVPADIPPPPGDEGSGKG